MKRKRFYRLRELYESIEQVRECGLYIKWGFDTAEDAWAANPLIELIPI